MLLSVCGSGFSMIQRRMAATGFLLSSRRHSTGGFGMIEGTETLEAVLQIAFA